MLRRAIRVLFLIAVMSGVSFISACGGGGPSATQLVLNWDANHEAGVNTTGGGYRVYYANAPGVNTSTATFVNVPYVSGSLAPTSVTMTNPAAGTYYFRVIAYSTFNPPAGSSSRTSPDSSEISVQFP
jgi:hypothetical protein